MNPTHPRPVPAGLRLLPHTADVIVAAWAPTATGCIEQAVRLAAVQHVGPAPKAITRHGLVVMHGDAGWQCQATVDV
jgi:SHS2 domain-containing protein